MDSTASPQFWGTFWGQISIELLGGMIGAFIFLFIVLLLFRPKIKVANFICEYQPDSMETFYAFKFVNKSFFSAHDIKVDLFECRRIPMSDGKYNFRYKKMSLVLDYISHIPGRPTIWRKKPENNHCITIRTSDLINNVLKVETNSILLKISLKHGLTGLSKVFEKEYGNEEDIQKGKFKPGTKFGVIRF